MSKPVIRPADPREPEARALLKASHAVMQATSPPEAQYYLSIEALVRPDIHFFVSEQDGEAVGCIALSEQDGYGEVKSMFVPEAARGTGVADFLLSHIEHLARDHGFSDMYLETGTELKAAQRLYERNGYRICGSFGDYRPSPWSLYMKKAL